MPIHVASAVHFVENHVGEQISCFRPCSASQERNRSRQTVRALEVSSIRILQEFLFFLHFSPLPVFGFDGETLLKWVSHQKCLCSKFQSISGDVIVFVKQSESIADVAIQRG